MSYYRAFESQDTRPISEMRMIGARCAVPRCAQTWQASQPFAIPQQSYRLSDDLRCYWRPQHIRNAHSGRPSFSANQTTSFFLDWGFGSGA